MEIFLINDVEFLSIANYSFYFIKLPKENIKRAIMNFSDVLMY
jgi:hypothetical protein